MFEILDPSVQTERLCGGSREEGCAYSVLATSPFGTPLEDFMICPPIPIDLQAMGFSSQGMNLFQDSEGTYHILDVVGVDHYPTVPDFIEEGVTGGFSRLFPKPQLAAAIPLLDPIKSRHYLAHAMAVIENPAELYLSMLDDTRWSGECPKEFVDHIPEVYERKEGQVSSCLANLWQCIKPRKDEELFENERYFWRSKVYGNFKAAVAPDKYNPDYTYGIFMMIKPHFEIVFDSIESKHEDVVKILDGSDFGWSVTNG